MAVQFKKSKKGLSAEDEERQREEALETRAEFAIEGLTADEELLDDDTFSKVHDEMKNARGGGDDFETEGTSDPEDDELLLEEVATELPAQTSNEAEVLSAPADGVEVAQLERALVAAKDRNQVAALTLRIARYHARAAALFVLNRGLVAGLRGAGEGIETRIEGIMIPAEGETMMARALESGKMVRGLVPTSPLDQRMLRAMGREGASDIAVLPIRIGKRVVNLLYVDNANESLPNTGLGALRILCAGVGQVYERLILERREGGAGS